MRVKDLLPLIKDDFHICGFVSRNENGDLVDEMLVKDSRDPKGVDPLLDREVIAVKYEFEEMGIVIMLADKEV